ncbi:MAG: hypothetical protein AAF530_14430 [Pseudomonadota bacterium]
MTIKSEWQIANRFIQPNDIFSKPITQSPKPAKPAPSGSNVVVRSESPINQSWILNPALSKACSQGHFRQAVQHHLVGIFQKSVYGAAVGGHASLIDRRQLAKENVVYVFKGQGTTNCRVYHRNA